MEFSIFFNILIILLINILSYDCQRIEKIDGDSVKHDRKASILVRSQFHRKNYNKNDIALIINLINYKKIHNANILLCPSYGKLENWQNPYNIIKYFMDNVGNILIKIIDIDDSAEEEEEEDINAIFTSSYSPHSKNVTTKMKMRKLFYMLKCNDFKQIVVLDLSCRKSKFILEQASKYGLFNASYHWLLLEYFPSLFKVDEYLKRLNINMNSEITLVKPQCTTTTTTNTTTDCEREKYDLYDIWNPSYLLGGLLNVTHMGNYSQSLGLQIHFKESTIINRSNLFGLTIRCMMVITAKPMEPFLSYLQNAYNIHLDSMHRFHFSLLSYVRDLFNFTFQLSRTHSWGYLNNGTFDGMIGALVRREIDIGGSPVFFYEERAKVVDFTVRSWIARPCFIFRHPKTNELRFIFLQPFSNTIWYCILICSIVVITLTKILTTMENKILMHNIRYKDDDDDDEIIDNNMIYFTTGKLNANNFHLIDNSFSNNILLFLGAICQQGLTENLRLASGRCIVIFILIFGFCIYQFYSASIVGSLLMEKPKTIKTLRDLIDSSLNIGIEDILYTRHFFNHTRDQDAIELFNKKVRYVNNKTGENTTNYFLPEYGLDMIKRGGYAFHVDVATAYKIIADTFSEQEVCELNEVQLFPPQHMVAVVQKGSPFREMITYGLRRVTETGLWYRQRKVWHSQKPKCVRCTQPQDLQVGMQTASSALFILLVGFIISLVILLFEICYYKLSGAQNNKIHTTIYNNKKNKDIYDDRDDSDLGDNNNHNNKKNNKYNTKNGNDNKNNNENIIEYIN